jgi:hypothetical protein
VARNITLGYVKRINKKKQRDVIKARRMYGEGTPPEMETHFKCTSK